MPPKGRKYKSVKELKNYFKCSERYKRINRSKIRNILQEFCSRIGLKIDHIILSRRKKKSRFPKPARIKILKSQITNSQMAFHCMKAKDLTNMSNEKYRLLRNLVKEINPIYLPSNNWISEMKFDLNNFFEIISINNGFYLNPEQKIQYVCKKFLTKNTDFKNKVFNIRLSADVTKISKTRIQILNFTFDLLDERDIISSVVSIYILGIFIFLHFL
jgi:hypothetical protein